MSLSMVALLLAAASCSGNKAKSNDSDSVATEIAADTVTADTTVADTVAVVEEAEAPAAPKTTNKKTTPAATRTDNKTDNPAAVANEQVKSAVDAAVAKTKEVAKEGVSDASEKAKSWKDKKKKQTEE